MPQGGFFDDAVAYTLRAEGFDASEDGTGRGTPLVADAGDAYKCGDCSHFFYQKTHSTKCPSCGGDFAENVQIEPRTGPHAGMRFDFDGQCWRSRVAAFAATDYKLGGYDEVDNAATLTGSGDRSRAAPVVFDTTQLTSPENRYNPQPGDACHPLAAAQHPPAIAFNLRGRDGGAQPETTEAASVRAASGGSSRSYIAFSAKDHGADAGEVSPTLRAGGHKDSHQNGGVMPTVAISGRARGDDGRGYSRPEHMTEGIAGALDTVKPDRVFAGSGVRRLTPRECERLQGWPDDHTRWRRKVRRVGNTWRIVGSDPIEQADGPRYRQAGNGITSTVSAWIGQRIVRFGTR